MKLLLESHMYKHVFIGQLGCKIHWILQERATNTILPDCILWKLAILFLYSERIQGL